MPFLVPLGELTRARMIAKALAQQMIQTAQYLVLPE
jgi:hypothetical protein